MQFDAMVVIVAAVNLIAVGAAWGNLVAGHNAIRREQGQLLQEFHALRKSLGLANGGEGLFPRREECSAFHRIADTKLDQLSERMAQVETEIRSHIREDNH